MNGFVIVAMRTLIIFNQSISTTDLDKVRVVLRPDRAEAERDAQVLRDENDPAAVGVCRIVGRIVRRREGPRVRLQDLVTS